MLTRNQFNSRSRVLSKIISTIIQTSHQTHLDLERISPSSRQAMLFNRLKAVTIIPQFAAPHQME